MFSRKEFTRVSGPFIVFTFVLSVQFCSLPAIEAAAPEGFEKLFNGKDFTGWCGREHIDPIEFRQLPEKTRKAKQQLADADLARHWRVEQGDLVNDGHGVYCTTEEEFEDFELILEWKMVHPGTDSGIYLRGCPQVQIWDPNHKPQRRHGAHHGSGGLWNNDLDSPGKDPLVVADRPIGQWNSLFIRILGDQVTIRLNGKLVVDNAVMHNFWNRTLPVYEKGPIQIQTHGGEMRFRNIYIRCINESKSNSEERAPTHHANYTRCIPGIDVSFDMVAIDGGTFLMGSPQDEEGRQDDEGPQVSVRVDPFWIGRYEVTWAEYQQFMNLCETFEHFQQRRIRPLTKDNKVDGVTAPSKLYDPSFIYEVGDDPKQPAVSMTQYAAKQYTKWLSLVTGEFYRLPSEAEWEYACRAGTTTAFSYGNDPNQLADYAWYYKNAKEEYLTAKVGKLSPNAWGLYDMHGNVWEWTLDAYDADHYRRFSKGTYSSTEVVNWPVKLFPRVLRGGSWYTELAEECRSATRLASHDEEWKRYDPSRPKSPWWLASEEGQMIGFRIVRPHKAPPRDQWNKYWDAEVEQIKRDVNQRIDKEGRGERGFVDPELPNAIETLKASSQSE